MNERTTGFASTHVGVVVDGGHQVLDEGLQRRRHQAVVVVTHLPVASNGSRRGRSRGGVSVEAAFGGVAATGLLAATAANTAASATAVAVRPTRTGSAMVPRWRRRADWWRHRRRRVRVLVGAVVALPGGRGRADRAAAVRAVRLGRLVRVVHIAEGAVRGGASVRGGSRAEGRTVAVRAVWLRDTTAVVVSVVGVGRAKFSGVRRSGRHDDLQGAE